MSFTLNSKDIYEIKQGIRETIFIYREERELTPLTDDSDADYNNSDLEIEGDLHIEEENTSSESENDNE